LKGKSRVNRAGRGGFGYDPVFYLRDYGLTMAQLPADEKHRISHRGPRRPIDLPPLETINAGFIVGFPAPGRRAAGDASSRRKFAIKGFYRFGSFHHGKMACFFQGEELRLRQSVYQ
jgi:hypothetical protein